MDKCKCGYDGNDKDHPCHGKGYTCRKPAKPRFYNAKEGSLAGMQMKLEAQQTWACDDCWKNFLTVLTGDRHG